MKKIVRMSLLVFVVVGALAAYALITAPPAPHSEDLNLVGLYQDSTITAQGKTQYYILSNMRCEQDECHGWFIVTWLHLTRPYWFEISLAMEAKNGGYICNYVSQFWEGTCKFVPNKEPIPGRAA